MVILENPSILAPRVGTSLCSNPPLSLLSLEWANAELALGLEFESLWKVNLTSSNIIILFCDYFASYDASLGFEVDLGEIENLIIPAIQHVESRSEQQRVGRNGLQEIIVWFSSLVMHWIGLPGS